MMSPLKSRLRISSVVVIFPPPACYCRLWVVEHVMPEIDVV
jgi:hypothetical protein